MYIKGRVKIDIKTKNLINRLEQKDIALISHKDLDEIAAISLADKKVSCVINTEKFISGKYPNKGPSILIKNNIALFEVTGDYNFSTIKDGDILEIIDNNIILGERTLGNCTLVDNKMIIKLIKLGNENLESELDIFIENTLEYAKKEKSIVTGKINLPKLDIDLANKQVLVVVRGKDYKADLLTIKSYIKEVKPILIGVDGGGDALMEFGYIPDLIIGDMDSVSDKCLLIAKEVIVHGYASGKAPGMKRVIELGIEPKLFISPGTSEDIALLLAYEKNADLIVALGTHTNMIDFLEKGRPGMGSTFLTRLKVGERLIDAKGVNKLYSSTLKTKHLILVVAAAFIPILIILFINPLTRSILNLMKIRMKILLGY